MTLRVQPQYRWIEGRWWSGAGNDRVFVRNTPEMQPLGHWQTLDGLDVPSRVRPSRLKQRLAKYCLGVVWVDYFFVAIRRAPLGEPH